jgi:hypothetical protein
LLIPALIATVANISGQLNTQLTGTESALDLDPAAIEGYFAPLDAWASDVAVIDYATIAYAVAPEWLVELEAFLDRFGVTISIASLIAAYVDPLIDQVRRVVHERVRSVAQVYIEELVAEYDATRAALEERVLSRLAATAPEALDGTALDHIASSGLWSYSFNITAVVLADHRVILPTGDPIATGPSSFDASYTPTWTQLGLCDYLGDAVFPEGFDMRALMSVRLGETIYTSTANDDAPVECHDGSLTSFGTPSATSCDHTSIPELLADPHGSLSRAYPPAHASGAPACQYLDIPGLPDPPPPPPDAGLVGAADGGVTMGDGSTEPGTMSGGCGCAVPGSQDHDRGALPWLALGALGVMVALRRRHMIAAVLLASSLTIACASEPGTSDLEDAGPRADAPIAEVDANVPEEDGGPILGGDAGPDLRRSLLDALGTSVWSGLQTRTEGVDTVERAYELHFAASSTQWAEIRNPFGPARRRRMRAFTVARDGRTVESTIMSPEGWPTDTDNGRRETWTFVIDEGSPRTLTITDAEGHAETFSEGAFPAPTTGLTAEVRAFNTGGAAHMAFCATSFLGAGMDRVALWEFARGDTTEPTLGFDVAAGVRLDEWRDDSGADRFSITDVPGFDRLGGTELSAQRNFVVRYTGSVTHSGGEFWMQEGGDTPDAVRDALWVMIGDGVGTEFADPSSIFLEVHSRGSADWTPAQPHVLLSAMEVPIEIFIVRCDEQIIPITVEVAPGSSAFLRMGDAPTTPNLDPRFFPPAL